MNTSLTVAIVMVHPGLYIPPRPSDSVARVIENQIAGLMELGHKVILIAPASSQVKCELIPVCDVPITIEEDPDGKEANQITKLVKKKILDLKGTADIIHAHSLDIPLKLFTSNFLEDCPLPHVTTMHSCVELENLKEFDSCSGPMISLSYNQRNACPNLNYVGNVYNGLDTKDFPFIKNPEGYLCFLGRITPEKQPHLALELSAHMGIPVKIAGPIRNKDYFDSKCKPFLDGKRAQYLGELDMKEKINLLAHALCNLYATGFRDPCPLVPMEAGFCGTPTLAISRGALPELITHNKTGVLVEDFTEAVSKLNDCIKLDRQIVSKISKKRFNHIRMAADYISIYKHVLSDEGTQIF